MHQNISDIAISVHIAYGLGNLFWLLIAYYYVLFIYLFSNYDTMVLG